MNTHEPNPWNEPLRASGRWVSLIPLAPEHEDGLIEAVRDGESWKLWYARVPSPEGMGAEIARRLTLAREGRMLPFTVLDRNDRIAGMTTYQLMDPANRRVEIGFTWYAARVQKTPLNTEAKLLLLTHAFETLQCIAVGFTTATFNEPSRRAIERLGAKLDGIIRNHSILPGGIVRDTCYYSILDHEWPAVKRHLGWKLEGYAQAEGVST